MLWVHFLRGPHGQDGGVAWAGVSGDFGTDQWGEGAGFAEDAHCHQETDAKHSQPGERVGLSECASVGGAKWLEWEKCLIGMGGECTPEWVGLSGWVYSVHCALPRLKKCLTISLHSP